MTNIVKNRNATPAPFGSVLDQLFPNNLAALLDDGFGGMGSPATYPIAPVNIRETGTTYEIELAAPGLRKSDFQLKIEGDTLSIFFEQSADQESVNQHGDRSSGGKDENVRSEWIRQEFTRSAFRRQFELSASIDREKISARYDEGILFLTLPKKENVRPATRQISIN
jgi:HSP20 family protein